MAEHQDSQQWEEFIGSMLQKLELTPEKYAAAEARYKELGRHVAHKLGIGENDAHVVVQGSMRTQTTIAGDGREKFDLDVIVKLCGPRFEGLTESQPFFEQFGTSLHGIQGAGQPEAMKRCWRLQYPSEPFYFDVTPAIPASETITGTHLRVRDPKTTWSPSNPQEFATWFCDIANQRFPFQQERMRKLAVEARTIVDPIPKARVRIDDILRRIVQLMKLHRDSYYKQFSDTRRDVKPISVILVTLAGKAYDELITTEAHMHSSAIEVALAVVERMPKFIDRGRIMSVNNPAMNGSLIENFADKWNHDEGVRSQEFDTWHERLMTDLEALFTEEYSKRSEERVRRVFGEHGVKAWNDSLPQGGVLAGLLATLPAQARSQPQSPRPSGYRDSLA